MPEELLEYAQLVAPVPRTINFAHNLLQKVTKKLLHEKTLLEQKQTVETLLIKNKKKIVVIIDDIDRLEATEILDIFKMIKSVGNFPKVIY